MEGRQKGEVPQLNSVTHATPHCHPSAPTCSMGECSLPAKPVPLSNSSEDVSSAEEYGALFISCMTQCKLLHLSVLQFPYLCNGIIIPILQGHFEGSIQWVDGHKAITPETPQEV